MKKSSMLRFAGFVVTAAAFFAVAGCSDDDEKPPAARPDTGTVADVGGDTSTATVGSISGTANYAGTQTGDLSVAAFREFPPKGPPAGVANVPRPMSYPATFVIQDLDPGKYFVSGFIMTGAPHMNPNEFDPQAPPVEVTVVAGQAATATITLRDPAPPADAGTDAPSDASSDARLDVAIDAAID